MTEITEQRDIATKIVCIEDDPAMVDLFTLILSNKGYDVQSALGGQEGLKLVEKERPDLILLDLMMPDMSGWDVYQRIKSNGDLKNTPVIIVTAKAHTMDKVLGLEIARVQDYVTKPFSPEELVQRVEEVLSNQGK